MPLAAFPKCYIHALARDHTMRVEDWLEIASAELRLDGVEFHPGFTPATHPERVRLFVRLRQLGLQAPMMCHAPDFTQSQPSARRSEVAKQCDSIRAIASLGGRYCRVLSGQWRPEVSREDGLRWAADCIAECFACAADHGVILTLENHYKATFWEFPEFAQSTADFLRLVALIPVSPQFAINYDPSNALIAGEDPYALLDAVRHRVATIHASDRTFVDGASPETLRQTDRHPRNGYAALLRHGVIGQGCIDYDRVFDALRGAGFSGWISIEDGDDPEQGITHLRASANFLRRKMAQYQLS